MQILPREEGWGTVIGEALAEAIAKQTQQRQTEAGIMQATGLPRKEAKALSGLPQNILGTFLTGSMKQRMQEQQNKQFQEEMKKVTAPDKQQPVSQPTTLGQSQVPGKPVEQPSVASSLTPTQQYHLEAVRAKKEATAAARISRAESTAAKKAQESTKAFTLRMKPIIDNLKEGAPVSGTQLYEFGSQKLQDNLALGETSLGATNKALRSVNSKKKITDFLGSSESSKGKFWGGDAKLVRKKVHEAIKDGGITREDAAQVLIEKGWDEEAVFLMTETNNKKIADFVSQKTNGNATESKRILTAYGIK